MKRMGTCVLTQAHEYTWVRRRQTHAVARTSPSPCSQAKPEQIVADFAYGGENGVAACETYGVSLHRSDDPRPFMNLATGFRYVDRFERRAGAWKIAERNAVGEWSLPIPAGSWWEIPDAHLNGRRDRSDVIYEVLSALGGNRVE